MRLLFRLRRLHNGEHVTQQDGAELEPENDDEDVSTVSAADESRYAENRALSQQLHERAVVRAVPALEIKRRQQQLLTIVTAACGGGALFVGLCRIALFREFLDENHLACGLSLLLVAVSSFILRIVVTARQVSFFSERELDLVRANNNRELAATTMLSRAALGEHVRDLKREVSSAQLRSMVPFAVGVLLCLASVFGPVVAWMLVEKHPDRWEYMLGGSALALILIGAGTSLLRHDTKIQVQVAAGKRELHYFRRVRTGLDFAQTLGESRLRAALETTTAHLLAPAPSLDPAKSEGWANRGDRVGDNEMSGESPKDLDRVVHTVISHGLPEVVKSMTKKA
jgi:hypothetical protein